MPWWTQYLLLPAPLREEVEPLSFILGILPLSKGALGIQQWESYGWPGPALLLSGTVIRGYTWALGGEG